MKPLSQGVERLLHIDLVALFRNLSGEEERVEGPLYPSVLDQKDEVSPLLQFGGHLGVPGDKDVGLLHDRMSH